VQKAFMRRTSANGSSQGTAGRLRCARKSDLSPIQKIRPVALAAPVGFAFGFVAAWLRDDPAGAALWSGGLACAVLFVVATLIAVLVDGRL
jgi:hypothetical protein